MRKEIIKFVGIFFIFLIIIDLVLFIIGKVSGYVFWVIVVICAIVAYKVLPWLRDKTST